MLSQSDKDLLESLLDKSDLQTILEALSAICAEKAQHIEASYADDRNLVSSWHVVSEFLAHLRVPGNLIGR